MLTPASPPQLQRDRFSRAFQLLEQAVAQQVFPGAAFSVVHRGALAAAGAVGHFTYELDSPAVAPNTLYDVASLTKVVATTAAAMLLYERGSLDLEAPVSAVLPEFCAATGDARRRRVTFRMLLAHSSGLPGYAPLYQTCDSRAAVIAAALALPLEAEPGECVQYSDIGFIVLGTAL